MITRVLVLAMVLAITLAVATPALAYNEFTVSDDGRLFRGGDIVYGKCSTIRRKWFASGELPPQAARACEKAGFPVQGSPTKTPLPKTGGLPVILVPITLLIVGGLLIRKTTAP